MKPTKAIKTAFSLYNMAWAAAIPFLKKKERIADGIDQRLFIDTGKGNADIWIQSASAGEAYLTLEILDSLSLKGPIKLWLTTNTRQGMDILEQGRKTLITKHPDLHIRISFAPFDKPGLMEKAVLNVRPRLMVLVELEMWPGLLFSLKKIGCKILIVNGRLTGKSLKRYLFFPSLWKALAPDEICAISHGDAGRFSQLFPNSRVRFLPNIKFDRLTHLPNTMSDNPLAGLFKPQNPIIVLGSVRQEEEYLVEQIVQKITRENPTIQIALFPRHMHRIPAWARRLDSLGIPWATRSGLTESTLMNKVILWDQFGELSYAYALATAAFVGGSLAPLGGQNFLEVLQSGVIPVTGPHWSNFSWVGEEIIQKGLLLIEKTWENVASRLLVQVSSPVPKDLVRQRAIDYLEKKKGGTQMVCERIRALFNQTP
ncbi:MAG: 3-deoxy-D-manno-octulosonic acid transferase [Proteobacteria bacterium]|nr:3-deoxy-D-manno-octulosonic acid transferase [Pseudomonadota bacterium]